MMYLAEKRKNNIDEIFYIFLFVCFVLCCAGKEEGETGVTYFKSIWVGTIVIKIN